MAALVWTVLVAIWTLVVVRLVAGRATLSDRTFATFLALGVLLGCLGGPASQKLFAPYGEDGPWIALLVALARQAVLLAPLFMLRALPAIGVADGFVLGFLIGFGYDLAAAVLAAVAASTPFSALQWIPPFSAQTDSLTVSGYSYWTGLVALAYAAARRFIR